MAEDSTQPRLPLVREAGRPADRPVVAAGQPEGAGAPAGAEPAGTVVALHGVGEFAHGDVIAQIAAPRSFAHGQGLRRETLFARGWRFTVLAEPGAAGRARLVEVNWSDVRRAMPNVLGLMRNFVSVLIALGRIGVRGAYRSATLSQRLWSGPLALWSVEALLVWMSLAPALSALLWQIGPGERLAAGVLVAVASLYTAVLVRSVSLPLAAGGVLFAVAAAWAGWWTCFDSEGALDFATGAGTVHSWVTVLAAAVVLVSAAEILLRPAPAGAPSGGYMVQRLARLACLWLPLILVIVLQPLTVSLLLLPMQPLERTGWGLAFARLMPFDPHDGQRAAGWVALALAGTLGLGALQFKLVQRYGRNVTVLLGWGCGLALLAASRWMELRLLEGCELCRYCLRPDWIGAAGLMFALGASITWVLFWRAEVARDPAGRAWYPAGAFARFWAAVMLAVVPIVLVGTLAWLAAQMAEQWGQEHLADASEIFLESTKYALLLAPLASKPFAAFIDALGDIFFFLVRQRNLTSRHETQPRLWQALRLLDDGVDGTHRIVFAHSQGTVIAAVMLSRMARVLTRSSMRVTLVTVGSPLTTLYTNFLGARLGAEFAALCEQQPQRFAWFNLARPADYIGGAIELPGVRNRDLLTPGDHVGYWSDDELLKWLRALCDGKAG
jgi:hypothetical protein